MANATWGDQVPGLNKAIGDIRNFETEVHGQLQVLRQGGTGGDVGAQIVACLRQAGARVDQITNYGYQQIEEASQDHMDRRQAINYWREKCVGV